MADSPLNDLNYGRPGLTTYDLEGREWTISREPTREALQKVSDWQLAIPAAINSPPQSSADAINTRKDARRLVHNHPQLVSAAKELFDFGSISAAVTSAVTTYDPHVGNLLSFGTIFLKKFVRPKEIAALPAGPSGNILRLVPMGQQRYGWEDDRSVWLQGPSFNTVDSGYWNEEAAPIRQVVFAKTETSNSFLALRLPSRTVIFRPSYHRGRRAAEPSPYYSLPPSVLAAQPIFSIGIDQTGGASHADVAFNPDYQFQLGLVDQEGTWSLWQIERRAKRDEYSASRMIRGHMLPVGAAADAGDGWARIFWVADSNTLLVCNRRHLSLIDVTGERFDYLPAPPVIPRRSSDWILDIKQHTPKSFFVMTSTKLFLVSVTTSSGAADGLSDQAGGTILFSRRHYRGDEDITLQLQPQVFEEQTVLFVTSRLNKLIQVYYLQDDSSGQPESITFSDPVILALNLPDAASTIQMRLNSLEYATNEAPLERRRNAAAQSYYEGATPFHLLTVVATDLSIHRTVLLSSKHSPRPERLAWTKAVVAKHSLVARHDTDGIEDLIEPDGPGWDAELDSKLSSQIPRQVSNQWASHATADRTWLYDSLLGEYAGIVSISDITQQLEEILSAESGVHEANVMESLDEVGVPDVDEASAILQQLFASQSTNVLLPIASQRVLQLPETEHFSLTNLYDVTLEGWIAPLPAQIPVPVRQAKERLARRIAAEVILASAQLRPRDDEHSVATSSDAVSLPVLPSKPVESLSLSLPTPPQSSVPPSSPLFPDSFGPRISDPLSRLRKHLTINDDSTMTPTVLPPSVSELLSHWETGTDPNTYDWEATERAIRPEAADEESQELLERERRKKQRREKRQRREDELLRAKTQTNNQPVFSQPAFPRSSPGPSFGGMAPSSQVPVPASSQIPSHLHSQRGGFGGFGGFGGMMPQSQVEPGRFGGRPDKKKKKGKSRVSGF